MELILREVPMVVLVKMISSQLVRWAEQTARKNKMPYRWFEVDHRGL
jgi:hypothetical protein